MANTQSNQPQKDDGKKWLRYVFFMVSCVTTGAVAIGGIYGIVSTTYHAPPGGSTNLGTSKSQQECIEDCLEDFGITSSITGPCKYDGKGYGGISKGKIDPIVKYLASKGYTKVAIAGILGNWVQESGLEPNNCQNSCEDRFGGDNESCAYKETDRPDNKQCGYGLAQWTFGTRKDLMIQYNQQDGRALSDLGFQLDFFNYEADNNYPTLKTEINKDTTPEEATYTFEEIYEGAGTPAYSNRVDAAKAIFPDINCDTTSDIQPIQDGEEPAEDEEETESKEETTEEAEPDSNFSGRRIINGVNYMNQGDYDPPIPAIGCGVTSSTMLIKYVTGKEIDPDVFYRKYGFTLKNGISTETGKTAQDVAMGTDIDGFLKKIMAQIDKQNVMVLFTGYHKSQNSYGHIMLIVGYITDDDGNLTHMVMHDPYNNFNTSDSNGAYAEYPIDQVKTNMLNPKHQDDTRIYYVDHTGTGGFTPSDLPGDYNPAEQTPEEYCKEKCKNVGFGAYDEECVNLILDIAEKPNADGYGITDGEDYVDEGFSCCAGFTSRVLNKAIEEGANIHPSYQAALETLGQSKITRTTQWADYCDDETYDCSMEGLEVGLRIDGKENFKPGDILTIHKTFSEYDPDTGQQEDNFTHTVIVSADGEHVYSCSGKKYSGKSSTISYYESNYLLGQARRVCLSGGGVNSGTEPNCGTIEETPPLHSPNSLGYVYPIDKSDKSDEGYAGDTGLDILADVGTIVRAVHDGTVTLSDDGGVQLEFYEGETHKGRVRIAQTDGRSSYYQHLSCRTVAAGQEVKAGDIIGLSGTANNSEHLHIGIFQQHSFNDTDGVLTNLAVKNILSDNPSESSFNILQDLYDNNVSDTVNNTFTCGVHKQGICPTTSDGKCKKYDLGEGKIYTGCPAK